MENKKEFTVSLEELEKELTIKEAIQNQIENALQQVIGQITCLRNLVKKAKREDKPAENISKEDIK